ncbi:hypothetical protein FQA47_025014 [Oryzias melastigma]|uniref:Uncharacterized protein n=1 Tax=Oryzias melastigma TaxID=30732 RepID=A0A834CQU5_ORYME|nr:hypothetical protein FQA47_025014 [Oryzias melastigma]
MMTPEKKKKKKKKRAQRCRLYFNCHDFTVQTYRELETKGRIPRGEKGFRAESSAAYSQPQTLQLSVFCKAPTPRRSLQRSASRVCAALQQLCRPLVVSGTSARLRSASEFTDSTRTEHQMLQTATSEQ